ncbi:MAG: VCBS repeat-containing protein [Verrucomicrobiae bacterium]|nr:VCBS repeat-containing protein [Verrucomicrobiae bacterium]
MKSQTHKIIFLILKCVPPAILLAAGSMTHVSASPNTLRPVPGGYSGKIAADTTNTRYYSPIPVVLDIGAGRPVWYGGGLNFSTYPYASNPLDPQFTISLPTLTMPNFPGMKETPQEGIGCDVDRDGDVDIVRINSWDGWDNRDTFQVFLNGGNGTFSKGYRLDMELPVFTDSHDRNYHIESADFDRDGDPDIVILMAPDDINRTTTPWSYPGTLTIRWNDGTGGFPTSTVLRGTGYGSDAALTIGDVDRDGDVDILCDGHTSPTPNEHIVQIVSTLFRNNGAGTFTLTTFNDLPARLADIDGDGWLDSGSHDRVSYNDGVGHFNEIWFQGFRGSAFNDYTYADADGDGRMDYISNEGGKLVYRRRSNIGFLAPIEIVSLPSPAAAIGAGDSDGDGDTDYFLHLENGTFAFVENRSLHQIPGRASSDGAVSTSISLPGVTELHSADFDRDGREDLLAVSPSQKKLFVLFGEDDGIPSAPVIFRNTSGQPHSAAVADFDLDGREDVAYTLPAEGEVRLARNVPGFLIGWPESAIATGLKGVSLLRTGELGTPNGRRDLLTGNSTTGQLRWLYQLGNGWNGQSVLNSSAPVPGCIMTADASRRPGDEVFLLGASETTIFLRGYELNPTWKTLGSNLATPVFSAPPSNVIAWAEVTGDSREEIVFVKGDGGLGYWDPVAATGGSIGAVDGDIRAIATADWDRDGRTDILCATSQGVELYYRENRQGVWARMTLAIGGGFTSIVPIDLNRDGWVDAAAGDSATGFVHFFTNSPKVVAARQTAPETVTLFTGRSGSTVRFEASNRGRTADSNTNSLSDVDASVSTVRIGYFHAVPDGSGWSKGSPLRVDERAELISSVTLVSGNTVIGSGDSGATSLHYEAETGAIIPIPPGETREFEIHLTLTSQAFESATNPFFVELGPTITGLQLDDFGSPANSTIPLVGVRPLLVKIVPQITPLQQWRYDHFGTYDATGAAANDSDPDGDGNGNLLEYVKGWDPNAAQSAGQSFPLTMSFQGAENRLSVALALRKSYDSNIRIILEKSTDLSSWDSLSTRTGVGVWSGVIPTQAEGSLESDTFTFETGAIPADTPSYFLRLRAVELP